MIIHHLKASGFRIMGEPLNIAMPDQGRIGVLGQNESGKTTLFQAIECALYGLKKGSGPESDRENLVTWGKNEAKLEIEFTSGQNRYNLQRNFTSSNVHKAVLAPVISGLRDKSSAVTGLKDVENKIEQITGMDRDSFCKLVYIKQKDLDALKELAKAKREQLVNKVMGIDLFDDAATKVKSDASEQEYELKNKMISLEAVELRKDEYESKVGQKTELETKINQQKQDLKKKEKEIDQAKASLRRYEWLFNHKSATETAYSLEARIRQIDKDLQTLQKLQKNSGKLVKILEKYKPEVEGLQTLRDGLLDIEKRLDLDRAAIASLQTQEKELSAKIEQQTALLTEKEQKLNSARTLVNNFEWLQKYSAAKEIESSLMTQVSQAEKDLHNLNNLIEKTKACEEALGECKPEFARVQSIHGNLQDTEFRLSQAEDRVRNLEIQKQETIDKSGLKARDLDAFSVDPSRAKNSSLVQFGATVAVSIGFFVASFLLSSLILGVLGVVFLVVAAYFFSRYLKIDRLVMHNFQIASVSKQIAEEENIVKTLKDRKLQQAQQTSFASSKDTQSRLNSISDTLYQKTGERSIDAAEALLKNSKENLNKVKESEPEETKKTLEGQLSLKRSEIEGLERKKPSSIKTMDYSIDEHDKAKLQLKTNQDEYDQANHAIGNLGGEVTNTQNQIKKKTEEIKNLQTQQQSITADDSVKNSEMANRRLGELSDHLKQETGESSIEGIEALLKSTDRQIESLTLSDPESARLDLAEKINQKKAEIQSLEETKPTGVEQLHYTTVLHEEAKKSVESLQGEHVALSQALGNVKGNLQQLEGDLLRLKPDFEAFPLLQEQVVSMTQEVNLLKRVQFELSETSKEMRNKVLPHARFIINQILPRLTSDRYSDFEITEDLKFKVYSNEGGGFKEREIFSGGTQDQFLIALRLAFTQSILDSRVMADKYSLLMDECTSSSDDMRKQGIFEVLDAMKQTFSQIFIIAHEDIANFVDYHLIFERNSRGYTEIKSKSWAP